MHKNILVLIAVLNALTTEITEKMLTIYQVQIVSYHYYFYLFCLGLHRYSLKFVITLTKKVMKNMGLIKYFNIIIKYIYKVYKQQLPIVRGR